MITFDHKNLKTTSQQLQVIRRMERQAQALNAEVCGVAVPVWKKIDFFVTFRPQTTAIILMYTQNFSRKTSMHTAWNNCGNVNSSTLLNTYSFS